MEVKNLKFISCWLAVATCLLGGCMLNEVNNLKAEKPSSQATFLYPSTDPKIAKLLNSYRKKGSLSKLKKDPERYAKNIISWQIDHGGFGLHDATFYEKPWDGSQKRSEWVSKGRELGNFDDGATVAEMRFLAEVYSKTTDSRLKSSIKASVEHCLKFIFMSQYENGGWPQVYPKRYKRTYSNNVTLNDDAMVRTMVLLSDILADVIPFDNDLVTEPMKREIYPRLNSAVDYLLKVQIKNSDKLTIWSSQYDQETDTPASARSYELVSKSGRESVGVLTYLMNWTEQSEKVVAAVSGGLSWYENNKIKNMTFYKGKFYEKNGAELWYRFYEVDSSVPFFSGRDGIKKYDLMLVEEERRKNYSWANNYASKILKVASRYYKTLE